MWQNNAVSQIFMLGWWWYNHTQRLCVCVCWWVGGGCMCQWSISISSPLYILVLPINLFLWDSQTKMLCVFFLMCATWPAHCILHALTTHTTSWRVRIVKHHSKWMGTEWQTVTYLYKIISSVMCIFTRNRGQYSFLRI